MTRARVWAAAITASIAVATASLASTSPVQIRANVDRYDVHGRDADGVLESLRRNAPVADGRRVFGRTRWNLRWSIRFRQTARACELESADVALDETVTLPRWVEASTAAPPLATQWSTFLSALELHEQGHADRAKDAAHEVHAALLRVATARCDDMNAAADAAARPIIARHNEADVAYDAATEHGRTQGAVWPPRR